MHLLIIFTLAACLFYSCKRPVSKNPALFNTAGQTVETRIKVPEGYTRVQDSAGSFGAYLRNLKLKPDTALVHLYDGRIKEQRDVYVAVIDMPIGHKDLQQCADAVMHLRAQYLYDKGGEDKIHFTFTNGFRADYKKWKEGYRISVKGNKAEWQQTARPADDSASFWQYLEIVFAYCGSLSLSRELAHINYKDLMPGDVLIRGGTPGHAEIVLDAAQNNQGSKIYLLAQSYMPAQQIHLLTNPSDARLSPWYALNPDDTRIVTPQSVFTTGQAMRFIDE